ncbi:MAG: hypothetical protein WAT41_15855 [Flavobacteriales bacterium]
MRKYTSWTKAKVMQEALKYDFRSDFKKHSPNAYTCAHRNGWIEEVCIHMIYKSNNSFKWNIGMIIEEARKYKSRTEFFTRSNRAYAAAARRHILDMVCEHMDIGFDEERIDIIGQNGNNGEHYEQN